MNNMKEYSVVFVGPVRNCGRYLRDVFKNIERIGSLFKSYSCVFVESDSTDNSLEILEEYSKVNPNVFVASLGDLEPRIQSRTLRIATARNCAIQICEEKGLLDTHDFYVQLCVDDVMAQEMDLEGIKSCFKYDISEWDCMTANQNTYYDLWTLRKKGWLDYDCWYEVHARPDYMSFEDAKNIFVQSRFIKIPKNYGLIEVDSAHGGFSIYKSSIVKGCRYRGYNEKNNFEESDIISFCEGVKAKGGKIFINSELINIKDN
jgi:glycosyltransferase involved in cell wall biosynthesis